MRGRLWGFLWGCGLLSGWLWGCVGPEDSHWRGKQAVSTDAELDRLQQALEAHASAATAFQLGQAYRRRGQWTQAAQSYQRALGIDPQHIESLFAMAELCLQMQFKKEAVPWIQRIEQLAPEKASVQRRCGFLYEAAQEHRRAEAAWRKALALDPADAESQKGLVFLLAAQDRWEEARQVAEKGRNAAAYRLLGRALLAKRRPAEALAQFQEALRLAPDSAEAYLDCADAWVACNDLEAAHNSLRQAQRLAPRSAAPWVKRGLLYEKQQRWEEAVSAYRAALERDPEEPVAANNLAYHYVSHGENLEEALRLAQLAYRKLPRNAHIRDTLALAYQALGQTEKARSLLEPLTQEFPKEAQFHYHLALVYRRLNRLQAARASAQRALALDDQFPEAAQCRAFLRQMGLSPR